MKGIYLTEEGKKAIEDKIAELEEDLKEESNPLICIDVSAELNTYKRILCYATILPVEDSWSDKQETLEEYIKEVTKNFGDEMSIKFTSGGIKLGAKWQAERMYSEEECYKYLHSLMTDIELKGLKINDDTDLKQWFDQFKKK